MQHDYILPSFYTITSDTTVATLSKSALNNVELLPINGTTPSAKIGITPGGDELMPVTLIDRYTKINTDLYFDVDSLVYVTLTSGGQMLLSKNVTYNPFNL